MFNAFGLLDLGAPELLIILAIVLLLFGGKKLPELSKSLGTSVKELKKGLASADDLKSEVKNQVSQTKQALHSSDQTKVQ